MFTTGSFADDTAPETNTLPHNPNFSFIHLGAFPAAEQKKKKNPPNLEVPLTFLMEIRREKLLAG